MSLALDANHDLYMDTRNNLATVSGAEAVAQGVLTALRLFRGEWHLAVTRGVPYFGEILGANPDARVIEFELRRVALAVPGVTTVRSMALDFDRGERRMSISVDVDSVFGPSGVVSV